MNKRAVALLSLGHLYVDFSAGTLPILLPVIAQRFDLTYATIGLVVAVSSFASSTSQPIFGYIADRRPVSWALAAGCLFGAVGYGLVGLAPTFGLVLLAVAVGGLAGTFYHPDGSKAMRLVAGSQAATGMSLFGVGGNVGLALGPVVTSALLSIWGPAGVVAILVPGLAMSAILLPYGRRLVRRRQVAAPAAAANASRGHQVRGITLAFLISTLRSWVHVSLFSFMPFIGRVGGDQADDGSRLVSIFLVAGAVANLLGGYIADRLGRRLVLATTMALASPALFLLAGSHGSTAYLLAAAVGALLLAGFAVTIVIGQELMPRHVGLASGLMMGLTYGIGALGVTATGQLADRFGLPVALQLTAAVPALAAVLSLLIPSSPAQAAVETPGRTAPEPLPVLSGED